MGSSKNVVSDPVDVEEGYNMMVRHSATVTVVGFFLLQEKLNFPVVIH